jgi:cytochrome b
MSIPSKSFIATHQYAIDALVFVIFLHVVAYLSAELREGSMIVSGMLLSRKMTSRRTQKPVDDNNNPA